MASKIIEWSRMEKELNREVEQLAALIENDWESPSLHDILKKILHIPTEHQSH